MKKLNKIAMGILLASAASANAGTFDSAASQSIGVEAATGDVSVLFANGAISVTPGIDYDPGDRLTITLDNGATFGNATYVLQTSGVADAGSWVLTTASPDGVSSIEFRAADTIPAGADFNLASTVGGGFNVSAPSLAAGQSVNVSASARDVIGVFDNFTAAEILEYANEFAGRVAQLADAEVNVNDERLSFSVGGGSDTIGFTFTKTAANNTLTANDNDVVSITLSGDMSGISSIAVTAGGVERGDMTLTADSATFEASASDVFSGSGSVALDISVDGATALSTRDFTVSADLDFETETDKNLVAVNTSAGEWTINGMQAKVAHLSLNTTGFISWLKVINEATTPAEVSADIIYTLMDGTEGAVNGASLLTVDAGGVGTVSEAAILDAIGNPAGVVDASLTVTVAAPTNLVHLTAEKKASDGRTQVPVYYNTGSRNWVQ